MNHLSTAQIYAHVLEHADLDEQALVHLQMCEDCQQEVRSLSTLAQTLQQGRRSYVSSTQMQSYFSLFHHVQSSPSVWERLGQQIQLALALDSRQRMGLQGLRSAGSYDYRLLYSAAAADVELLVKPQGQVCTIEGEVLPLDAQQLRTPFLVELFSTKNHHQNQFGFSTESTVEGRFQLPQVTLGYYDLVITPTEGPFLQIKGIDIT